MKHKNLHRSLVLPLILLVILGLCFINPVSAQGETTVSISPLGQEVSPEQVFTVEIIVDPELAIAGMQFNLSFDASLFTVDSVEEGNLLNQNGASTYFTPGTIDNVAGTITSVAGAITTSGETVSSPGIFAIITLTSGTVGGTSRLDLSNVIVGDIEGNTVSVEVNSGSVNIVGASPAPTSPPKSENDKVPDEASEEVAAPEPQASTKSESSSEPETPDVSDEASEEVTTAEPPAPASPPEPEIDQVLDEASEEVAAPELPAPPPAQPESTNWPLTWGIIGGVIIVFGLSIFIQLRRRSY